MDGEATSRFPHLEKLSLKACPNGKCLATKHHQTLFGEQTFYRSATLFGAVWSCLIVFGCVWKKLKAMKHSIKQLKTFLLFSCLMGDVLFVWTAVSNMFGARKRPMLAQRLVFIVCSVFDQTFFNRLATHFNISMFGHQTMFYDFWLSNISCLDRPLKFQVCNPS